MAPPVSISRIIAVLRQIAGTLTEIEERWALIGGLAVGVRTEPRFTRDVDLAIAVAGDEAAESLIYKLGQQDYRVVTVLENNTARRLATVRLLHRTEEPHGVIVDLLFASCGIENEIVAEAEAVRIFPDFTVPIARRGHLVAMKLLAERHGRMHDGQDLILLLQNIPPLELARARESIALIEARGYSQDKPLDTMLEQFLEDANAPPDPHFREIKWPRRPRKAP